MFTIQNDVKAIGKLNVAAHKSGEKFAKALHEAAFNCVMHLHNTGDVRLLQHLFDGLSPRAKSALAQWAVKHCPKAKFDHKAGSFGYKKSDEGVDVALIQELGPMDYVPVKAARTTPAFNLKAELEKLYKRAAEKAPEASKALGFVQQAIKAA